MFNPSEMLRLRLAPPSERYQRVGMKSSAFAFADALASVTPEGTEVFKGDTGFVVTLRGDVDAAVAAGAGKRLYTYRGIA